MAGSDEANSHPANGNNTRINITGAELQAMITAAVSQAVDAKFKEPITAEPKRIARFIGGLAPEVKGNVKASKPATYRSAVDLSLSLSLDVVRSRAKKATDEGKRKREDDKSPQLNKKNKGNSGSKKGQSNDKPRCKTCYKRHFGKCNQDPQAKPCGICKKKGHKSVECRNIKDATCYGCNEKGHIKTNCPKNAKKPEEAKKTNARVFQMQVREAVNDENVITESLYPAIPLANEIGWV
ncbi:uncharacterized protein LOC110933083 [Helianthus annuus]|uniref:uncharacterized protein LOC110933083 n=1 Tax=Helianthus annuus TaxID=4232 RepID=UPI000B8FA8E7|nr:uncharacterized protein LOC110933083 [Helianthus annuus]